MITSRIAVEGGRNAVLEISGIAEFDSTLILGVDMFKGVAKAPHRIDSIIYALEFPVRLWWLNHNLESEYFLSLDGRGKIEFINPIHLPKDFHRINMSMEKQGGVFIQMDLTK